MDYLIVRLMCALISGMLLSQAGSLIQMSTRNVLASPSTLGFDGLAILWLVCFHSLAVTVGGLEGSIGILLGIPFFILVAAVFTRMVQKRLLLEKIILLGLTLNLLVGAVFSLWQFFFMAFNLPFPVEVWFGHFRHAEPFALMGLALVEMMMILSFIYFKKPLLLFSLGEELAENFQLNTGRLYSYFFLASILATYVVVSFFGAFAFLGLIFPIFARKLCFNRFDLEGEFLLGSLLNGLLLMTIDSLCYFFPILGAEIPVGLLVSAVGAVSLILLLWSSKPSQLLAKQLK